MYRNQYAMVLATACRTIGKFFSVAILFSLFTAAAYGQQTGTVRGTVKNLATGKVLYNARIQVDGTNVYTTTNEYGEYRLSGLPLGKVTLTASYTSLDPREAEITVVSGESSIVNFDLFSRRYGEDEEIFIMDEFQVSSGDMEGNAVALNEQRYADNVKNIVATDAYGDIAEGNIGEFVKFLPGISINYVAADVRSIEVRGMGANFTPVTVDGNRMASAASSSKDRTFELEQVSINNVERIEVAKVPLPDMSADALGGTVNLISKNAFEKSGRSVKYNVYFNMNSDYAFEFGKTAGPAASSNQYKTLPGFILTYSDVMLDKTLGFSLTLSSSNQMNVQHRAQFSWRHDTSDGSGDDTRDAFVSAYRIQDGPKFSYRNSISGNLDWKASEQTVVSFKTQYNYYESEFFNRNIRWSTGNTVDPGTSNQLHTEGLLGEGNIDRGGSFRNKYGETYHVDLTAKHYLDDWDIDYGVFYSDASNHYRSEENGYVEGYSTSYLYDPTVSLTREHGVDMHETIDVRNEDGTAAIPNRGTNLENFRITRVQFRPVDGYDSLMGVKFNAKYRFEMDDNPGFIKFGISQNVQTRETWRPRIRYDYIGETPLTLGNFKDDTYSDADPYWGHKPWDWVDHSKLYDYFDANRDQFALDAQYTYRYDASDFLDLEETVTAYYLMGRIALLDNTFTITGGFRFEETEADGRSGALIPDAYLEKDPLTGEIVIGEDGNGIDKFADLDAGAPNDRNRVNKWKAIYGTRIRNTNSYDGWYPSLHLKWDVTDNIVARLSYANTIGRQNFGDMFGIAEINEFNDDGTEREEGDKSVTLPNAGLLPQDADNYDFTIEYYFSDNSVLSGSYFYKELSDYSRVVQETITQDIISAYDLPERTEGWLLNIRRNVGDATVKGAEFNYNHTLSYDFLPEFLQSSSVFASGTFLETEGDFGGDTTERDFDGFVKTTMAWGVIYDYGPLNLKLRWSKKGREYLTDRGDVDGATETYYLRRYNAELVTLDVNAQWKFNRSVILYVNGRNVTIDPQVQELLWSDQVRPERIEEFGIQWTIGIKGTL